jgi:hypothetical protein
MILMKLGLRRREMSFCIRPSCQTVSKALSISKKTARVHSFRFACRVESVWNSRIGLMVERCGTQIVPGGEGY